MLYIVEVSHQYSPVVYTCKDKSHFIRLAEVSASRSGREVLIVETGADLLENYGDEDGSFYLYIKELVREHGLEKKYYKSFDDEEFTLEPQDFFEVSKRWFLHDLHSGHVFESREEALESLFDGTLWRTQKEKRARRVLKEKLEEEDDTKIDLERGIVLRALTKEEAVQALRTVYGKECLAEYGADDLTCITDFTTDGTSFYTVNDAPLMRDGEWLFCDDFSNTQKLI